MAGMWELPSYDYAIRERTGTLVLDFTVRHSITVTDYTVRVGGWRMPSIFRAR